MHELIPLIAGVVVGLAVSNIRGARLRMAAFVALSVLVGGLVSLLMGELATGAAAFFFSMDATLVWLGGVVAVLAVSLWRSRGAGRTAQR